MAGIRGGAFVVLCACVALGIGCSSSPSSVSAPARGQGTRVAGLALLAARRRQPMGLRCRGRRIQWQGMFVTRVRRLPGPRFSLMSSQGSHVLEVRADGIVREESKAYVLRAPLAAGAQWPGENDATVRVSSMNRIVEVPAGKFVGCVETIEEVAPKPGKNPSRRVTTTYCPDVGIALLHVEAWEGACIMVSTPRSGRSGNQWRSKAMKLFLLRGCPFAHRASIVLQEKKLDFEPYFSELASARQRSKP